MNTCCIENYRGSDVDVLLVKMMPHHGDQCLLSWALDLTSCVDLSVTMHVVLCKAERSECCTGGDISSFI